MRTKKLLFALLALVVGLPVFADNEFTDANGTVWTYEYVNEEDPSQGVKLASFTTSADELVIPFEISVDGTTLPVLGIEAEAFEGYTTFSHVTIPEGTTSIPDNFFENCIGLTSITIPEGVTSIGGGAFYNCHRLSSVTLPSTITRIGAGAFRHCDGLTSVNIPEGVTIIDGGTFYDTAINAITIPESVTRIEGQAFIYCRSLTSITIPSSVTYIGGSAFQECDNLTSIIVSEGNEVYDSRDNCNAVIETATNKLILGCQGTVIPSSVTDIADGALNGCRGLTSITIPSGMKTIGANTFSGTGITSITIPEGVTAIGAGAFSGCSLNFVSIPASVTSIGEYAFVDCNNIISIVVKNGNPVYDSRDNCNAIIETASNKLLLGCQNTVIPSSVTSIINHAFNQIGNSIVIPEGVKTIGNNAFNDHHTTNNISISIPSSVTSIGLNAFPRYHTTSITVDKNNPVYDSRDNCNAIIETASNTLLYGCQNTSIPSSVISIGNYAFSGSQEELTSITTNPMESSAGCLYIPSSVLSIGEQAFSYCSLVSVTIPPSIAYMGNWAFGACGTTSFVSEIQEPFVLNADVFEIPDKCVLTVPFGTKEAYIEAGWTTDIFGGGIVEEGIIPESVSIKLGNAGAGTFCSKYDLDFSDTEDVKAYIVSAFKHSTGEVTLTRITNVPAKTGIVLLGNAGTYNIPVNESKTVVANLLTGTIVDTKLNKVDGRYTNFVLANGSSGLGFYTVADGSVLAAGKAYLSLLTAALPLSASSISIRFDDDATMIDDMEAECETAAWHDLSGRKMDELPTAKGVYIVNGKKVVVK